MKTHLSLSVCSALGVAAAVAAADYTWMAAPPNSIWDTSTKNWNSGEKWVDGGNAVFPVTSDRKTINVSGPRRAADVTINGTSYTFQAYNGDSTASLEVTGTFTANESVTIKCPIAGEGVRLTGATDKVLTMQGTNSRQSVTYIQGAPVVQATADGVFGPVPQSVSDNIVAVSGTPVLMLNKIPELAANRSLRIEPGTTLRLANATNDSPTVVRGVISGRPDATLGFVTNACVSIYRKWTWVPHIVFDPGDGRTNDVGRLDISESNLTIASGTTRIGSPANSGTSTSAPLYVHGKSADAAFHDEWGNLVVDGGTLYASQQSRYADIRYYGQVTVTNGGCVNMPSVEWLNGQGTPARLNVSDGGSFIVRTLRLSGTSAGTEVVLGKGGLLTVDRMGLCPPVNAFACRFLFDGGAVRSSNGREDFLRSTSNVELTDADWANVAFVVGEKGAVFDSTNGKDIYWSRPLVADDGAADDGGLRVTGAGASSGLVLSAACTYGGTTVVENATLDVRVDGALPSGTTLRLSDGVLAANGTVQTLVRIEGSGGVTGGSRVSVTGSVAPSAGGTLSLPDCTLSGSFEILGNASGCGCIAVAAGQSIAGLELAVGDMPAPGEIALGVRYKILDAPDGYAGAFRLAQNFPSDQWLVRYDASAAYLSPVLATIMILR